MTDEVRGEREMMRGDDMQVPMLRARRQYLVGDVFGEVIAELNAVFLASPDISIWSHLYICKYHT